MALSISNTITDSAGRELLEYGTPEFPIAFYLDDLDEVEVPWHWHSQFELVITTQGAQRISAGGNDYVLKEGDSLLLNSGVLHSAVPLESHTLQHVMVFDATVLGEPSSIYYRRYLLPFMRNPSVSVLVFHKETDWQSKITQLAEEAFHAGAYDVPLGELIVRDSLSMIFRQILSHEDSLSSNLPLGSDRDITRAKQMIRYMEEHVSEELSLTEIAADCHLSVSEALRCFKRIMNTSPIRFLNQLRLRKAGEQLTTTDRPINEIAAQCGFHDMSYFTRVFKAEKHMTPTQYRKKTGT